MKKLGKVLNQKPGSLYHLQTPEDLTIPLREKFRIHSFHNSSHQHEAVSHLYSHPLLPVADGPGQSTASVWPCVLCSRAVSVNVHADSQVMQLQNYSTLGKQQSMGARLPLTWCGVCMLGERRDQRRSEDDEGLEKFFVHTCCMLLSFPACGLWVLPGDERPGVLCKGKPPSTLTPAHASHQLCRPAEPNKQRSEISTTRTLLERQDLHR